MRGGNSKEELKRGDRGTKIQTSGAAGTKGQSKKAQEAGLVSFTLPFTRASLGHPLVPASGPSPLQVLSPNSHVAEDSALGQVITGSFTLASRMQKICLVIRRQVIAQGATALRAKQVRPMGL